MGWYTHRVGRGFVAAGIVVAPLVTASAAHAWIEPDSVTVAFVGTSAGQGRCTASPEPAKVSLQPGAELIVVNRTERYGVLQVGERDLELLAVEQSTSVELSVGQHTIRLWPVCARPRADPLTVLVDAPPPATTSSPLPPTQPPGGAPRPPRSISDRPAGSNAAPPATPPGPTPSTASSEVPPPNDPTGSPTETPPSDTPMSGTPLGGEAAAGPPQGNGKAGRLLALIAGICVLGVTSGLIRAIVTQRTSRSTTMIGT